VQREWRSLLSNTDKSVEQALRQTIKKSLQELSRAINGDQRVDAQSLFKVRFFAAHDAHGMPWCCIERAVHP
jgi:hypothetical protein